MVDGEHVSRAFALVHLSPGADRRVDRIAADLEDLGTQGVRPLNAAELVIVKTRVAVYEVTFEEEAVLPSEIAQRMNTICSASLPWLVAEVGGEVVGYAYASKWNGRCAYKFSAEITVYLAPAQTGRGLGSRLYGQLFPLLRERGMHAVIGGIALPNDASVALHQKFGLEKAAHFREVGFKFDRWIDVGYWQRTL